MVWFSSKKSISIFLQIWIGQVNYLFQNPQNWLFYLLSIWVMKIKLQWIKIPPSASTSFWLISIGIKLTHVPIDVLYSVSSWAKKKVGPWKFSIKGTRFILNPVSIEYGSRKTIGYLHFIAAIPNLNVLFRTAVVKKALHTISADS